MGAACSAAFPVERKASGNSAATAAAVTAVASSRVEDGGAFVQPQPPRHHPRHHRGRRRHFSVIATRGELRGAEEGTAAGSGVGGMEAPPQALPAAAAVGTLHGQHTGIHGKEDGVDNTGIAADDAAACAEARPRPRLLQPSPLGASWGSSGGSPMRARFVATTQLTPVRRCCGSVSASGGAAGGREWSLLADDGGGGGSGDEADKDKGNGVPPLPPSPSSDLLSAASWHRFLLAYNERQAAVGAGAAAGGGGVITPNFVARSIHLMQRPPGSREEMMNSARCSVSTELLPGSVPSSDGAGGCGSSGRSPPVSVGATALRASKGSVSGGGAVVAHSPSKLSPRAVRQLVVPALVLPPPSPQPAAEERRSFFFASRVPRPAVAVAGGGSPAAAGSYHYSGIPMAESFADDSGAASCPGAQQPQLQHLQLPERKAGAGGGEGEEVAAVARRHGHGHGHGHQRCWAADESQDDASESALLAEGELGCGSFSLRAQQQQQRGERGGETCATSSATAFGAAGARAGGGAADADRARGGLAAALVGSRDRQNRVATDNGRRPPAASQYSAYQSPFSGGAAKANNDGAQTYEKAQETGAQSPLLVFHRSPSGSPYLQRTLQWSPPPSPPPPPTAAEAAAAATNGAQRVSPTDAFRIRSERNAVSPRCCNDDCNDDDDDDDERRDSDHHSDLPPFSAPRGTTATLSAASTHITSCTSEDESTTCASGSVAVTTMTTTMVGVEEEGERPAAKSACPTGGPVPAAHNNNNAGENNDAGNAIVALIMATTPAVVDANGHVEHASVHVFSDGEESSARQQHSRDAATGCDEAHCSASLSSTALPTAHALGSIAAGKEMERGGGGGGGGESTGHPQTEVFWSPRILSEWMRPRRSSPPLQHQQPQPREGALAAAVAATEDHVAPPSTSGLTSLTSPQEEEEQHQQADADSHPHPSTLLSAPTGRRRWSLSSASNTTASPPSSGYFRSERRGGAGATAAAGSMTGRQQQEEQETLHLPLPSSPLTLPLGSLSGSPRRGRSLTGSINGEDALLDQQEELAANAQNAASAASAASASASPTAGGALSDNDGHPVCSPGYVGVASAVDGDSGVAGSESRGQPLRPFPPPPPPRGLARVPSRGRHAAVPCVREDMQQQQRTFEGDAGAIIAAHSAMTSSCGRGSGRAECGAAASASTTDADVDIGAGIDERGIVPMCSRHRHTTASTAVSVVPPWRANHHQHQQQQQQQQQQQHNGTTTSRSGGCTGAVTPNAPPHSHDERRAGGSFSPKSTSLFLLTTTTTAATPAPGTHLPRAE